MDGVSYQWNMTSFALIVITLWKQCNTQTMISLLQKPATCPYHVTAISMIKHFNNEVPTKQKRKLISVDNGKDTVTFSVCVT